MLLVNSWLIKIFSNYVGKDSLDNCYYQSKSGYNSVKKRYVIYNNIVEPTTVSPSWYAWLHYLTDEIPMNESIEPNRVNYTGTELHYTPNVNNTPRECYNSWHP